MGRSERDGTSHPGDSKEEDMRSSRHYVSLQYSYKLMKFTHQWICLVSKSYPLLAQSLNTFRILQSAQTHFHHAVPVHEGNS